MDVMDSGGSPVGQAGVVVRFALLAVAWGSSFLFIKIGLEGLSPVQVVVTRMVFGALLLGLIMLVSRRPIPRDPALWGHLTVVSMLLCVLPFTLFAWAEQEISSGLASIYNATTPLTTLAFATLVLSSERLTRDRGLGLGFGFVGVLVIVGPWSIASGDSDLLPQAACLAATTSYGLAFVYLRRFVTGRGVPAVTVAFVQVTAGAVILLSVTPLVADTPVTLTTSVVLSMVALGAVSTGLAYVWNTKVVEAWGAANAAAVTYLTPVVGVVLGILVLREPLSWNQPVGAGLVIAGILAAHGRFTRAPARVDEASTPVQDRLVHRQSGRPPG